MRILIVDDNPDDVLLIERKLARHFGTPPETLWAHNPATMAEGLAAAPDAILCDYNIPLFEWPAALQMAQALPAAAATPFVVFSGSITAERGDLAIKDGADEYVSKDNFEQLGPAVERVIKRKSVFGANQSAADQMARRDISGDQHGQ